MNRDRSTPSLVFSLLSSLFFFRLLVSVSAQVQPKTDETEANILNSMIKLWGVQIPNLQNPSDPCIGNSSIKCNCSFDEGTCHITELNVNGDNSVSNVARGEIPEAIGKLKYLKHLNLSHNYLSGSLPKSIGNLTMMQMLDVGFNKLTGSLPHDLGKLRDLTILSLRSNAFSGSLPTEFGNLSSLKELYIDSCGLNGTIPLSFVNLRNLERLFASDNQFTGKIPEFLGTFSNLTQLRLQGNSFEGPIPLSFSNLTRLTDLRVSELLSISSTFTFMKNLTSLETLILRNNIISDQLPGNIGEYKSLKLLDLSFNNISGTIPPSLFNLNSLVYLFLGNNNLVGSLPTLKSSSLRNIDVSYNLLTGRFPSWVDEANFNFNMLFNNFGDNVTNSSAYVNLRKDWNCLQRSNRCKRNPLNFFCAINCGGDKDVSPFVKDDFIINAASYYVTDTFAVSSVGSVISGKSVSKNLYPYPKTDHPDVFQSVRTSQGSLRYYILGLVNGLYNITLEFTETLYDKETDRDWKSLGRRLFDIYIQGSLHLKDFDIRKEAGGLFSAVEKKFNATVSDSILEVHLFWAGKGTCCVPYEGNFGPIIASLKVDLNGRNQSLTTDTFPISPKKNVGLIVGVILGIIVLMIGIVVFYFYRKGKMLRSSVDRELLIMSSNQEAFSYAELRIATHNFSSENKIGEGGFGSVYKGTLEDGRLVAVKNLSVTSNQGITQFMAEVATISSVQHRNLVKLYGCCTEGKRKILVYEYLENKSLDQALFGKNSLIVDWNDRYNICLGTARALVYLHEESNPRIIHRDIKASNVLLDSDLNPKISDFGLAKLYDDVKTHISTAVAGTTGYLAPEYAMRGHLSEKVDVFAYGILVLEILSGRSNVDNSVDEEEMYLLDWAWNLHGKNRSMELVDPTLLEVNVEEAVRLIQIALLCTQSSPGMRPSMSKVVSMVSGNCDVIDIPSKPGYLSDWIVDSNASSFATDTRA